MPKKKPPHEDTIAKLIDGRAAVCVGHLSDCDCRACRIIRRAIADMQDDGAAINDAIASASR